MHAVRQAWPQGLVTTCSEKKDKYVNGCDAHKPFGAKCLRPRDPYMNNPF